MKINQIKKLVFYKEHLEKNCFTERKQNIFGYTGFQLLSSWTSLCLYVLVTIIIFTNINVNINYKYHLLLIVFFIISPLSSLSYMTAQLSKANVASYNIKFLLSRISAQSEIKFVSQSSSFDSIVFRDVIYRYNTKSADSFILGPLSIEINPGEIDFLVGKNGSGKTTLIKILLGLYNASNGYIYWDNNQINNYNLVEYRQLFSVVFDDFYLFHDAIGLRNQIFNNIDEDLVNNYLYKFQLNESIKFQDGTLSTTTALSHGQKKRLALLYVCLENRPIYVFDELSADQDPKFREYFYTVFLNELKEVGKCIIVISHDDKYFHIADKIIHLHKGVII